MLGQLVKEIHALAAGPAMVTGPSSETLTGRSWLLSCSVAHETHTQPTMPVPSPSLVGNPATFHPQTLPTPLSHQCPPVILNNPFRTSFCFCVVVLNMPHPSFHLTFKNIQSYYNILVTQNLQILTLVLFFFSPHTMIFSH